MKLAVICHDYEFITRRGLSMHFVLAQKALDDHQMIRHYMERSAHGDFIILDNGAAEDEHVKTEDLIHVANWIRADEVVLPDVLRDAEQTIMLSTDHHLLGCVPMRKRMVVPQGKNWEEWEWCLRSLLFHCTPATIGVPKWLNELPGGRAYALRILLKLGVDLEYNVHLLGASRNLETEMKELNFHWVRSMDTAQPIAMAQKQLNILKSDEDRVSYEWGEPFVREIAVTNIQLALSWARDVRN